MIIAKTVTQIRKAVAQAKARGKRVGLVPTMGALHEGHLSLVRKARKMSDYVVVSVFVNPLQFALGEDLKKYPRDFAKDRELLKKEKVDAVFCPTPQMMYGEDFSTYVDEDDISKPLCGGFRPGHFRGVCTVVAKLFNIVTPDTAYFGQKDYQQVKVIERMVRDLNIPLTIETGPIIREETGLAMSSRNEYLAPQARKKAACIYQALKNAEESCRKKEKPAPGDLIRKIKDDILDTLPGAEIQYVEIVDAETLTSLAQIKSKTLIAVAVYVGKVRLIDNIVI